VGLKDDAATGGRGGEAHGLAFDVGDKESVHRIAGAATALVGELDIVVHAASTLGRPRRSARSRTRRRLARLGAPSDERSRSA